MEIRNRVTSLDMTTTTESFEFEIHHAHRDVAGGWLRPTVFGMMDGLCSNLALVAGVAGAQGSTKAVALAGLAGLVGGAFSMGTGEYTSVRSQNESMLAEIEAERHELRHNPLAEQRELAEMYVKRGVDPELAQAVSHQLLRDPDQALEVHVREELGVDLHDLPNPWTAAISSFLSFIAGAAIPLLPYLLGIDALGVAAALTLVALFVAGAVVARYTTRTWWYSGARQLLFGLASAAVTYGIGHLVGAAVG
ncbi:VIT1/CCC1 transporter family protein [Microtetraspora malaysiensis]|uniref:VIT1/CCC1 transporter family protein n=1 Tax=Microtetraspora malaysiensis TaxID=161358 RepID=UPI003D9229C1